MEYSTEKVMSVNIALVQPEESMHHVYFKMKQSYIKYMPVSDKNGVLVGIITDQDLNRPIPSKAKVRDYMSTPVGQATHDTPLLDIARRMLDLKLNAVVITEKKHVVGVITATDLVQVLVPLLALQGEMHPAKPNPVKPSTTSNFVTHLFHN